MIPRHPTWSRRRLPSGKLTPRQLEVLRCISAGHTQVRIAKELKISVATVQEHTSNIYRQSGCNCVALLIKWAIRNRVIEA